MATYNFLAGNTPYVDRFPGFTGGYPHTPKSWTCVLDDYPRAAIDIDSDPNIAESANVGVTMHTNEHPYTLVVTGYEVTWDFLTNPSVPLPGPTETCVGFGYRWPQGTLNQTYHMKRVITLVHELAHALIHDDILPTWQDAAYPGVADLHDLPGLTAYGNIYDDIRGGFMGGSWCLVESTADFKPQYGPYVLRFIRYALLGPGLYHWE